MRIEVQEPLVSSFRYPLLFLQIFGFMPVSGIFREHPNKIKFTWINLKTFYSILTIFGLAFFTLLQAYRFIVVRITIIDVNRLCLSTKSLVASVMLFKLARKWKGFTATCFDIDKAMITYRSSQKLNRKVHVVLINFGIAFLGDYILLQAVFINEYLINHHVSLTFGSWNYLQRVYRFPYVYNYFHYEFVSGIALLVIQLQILVCTALMDALIIVISLAILQKQKQVSKRIRIVSHLQLSTLQEWKILREDYNRLQRFCKYADEQIGPLILLSFTSNLVILLIQLFVSLRSNKSIAEKVYLIYTFFYVIFRILSVSLYASEVNEESQRPLKYLYSVPENNYNIEIDRLIHQISRKTMALSGMNFFSIKRNIVLQIAGSIVTYELVVMQFIAKYSNESDYQNYTLPL